MGIVVADAVVDLGEAEAVLEGAGLDEAAVRDVGVVGEHAVCEAEGEFGGRVEVGGAEEDDVAEAFGGAVFAGEGVGGGVDAADVGEAEVDFVGYLDHGGYDEFGEAGFGVGAFGHDVGFEGDFGGVLLVDVDRQFRFCIGSICWSLLGRQSSTRAVVGG